MRKYFAHGKKILILVLFTGQSLVCFSQKEDVMAWGIYLDLKDQEARKTASALSKIGFGILPDSSMGQTYLLLTAGDISTLPKILKKKKKDAIRVHQSTRLINEACPDPTLAQDTVIHYKYIRNNLISQQAAQAPYFWPKRMDRLSEEKQNEYLKKQEKHFKKFLKDKKGGKRYREYDWILLGVKDQSGGNNVDLKFKFEKKGKELAVLRFDTLQGEMTERFPVLKAPCSPLNRITQFKEVNGLGPDYIKPAVYRPRAEKLTTKRFTLHFEKNKYEYSRADIQEILNLLKDSSYSIVSARVEGYSSVEGTVEINDRLQTQRARVLLDILQKQNDEIIELDTLIVSENWDTFYKQIKGSSFEWLSDISMDSVKALLRDESFQHKLEPLLSDQRKAILSLRLTQKLSREEKMEMIPSDMRDAARRVCEPLNNKNTYDFRARMMGIIQYVEDHYDRGEISADMAREMIGSSRLHKEVLFYKAYHDYIHRNKVSRLFDPWEIISAAHDMFIEMVPMQSKGKKLLIDCIEVSEILQSKLVDVQLFSILLMKDQVIGWERLCDLHYPDYPAFYSLTLNWLYYMAESPEVNHLSLPCFFTTSNRSPSRILVTDPFSRYYYLIRKIILEGDEEILNHAYRSDNLLEFDLASFLHINISRWDARQGVYYDSVVNMDVMSKQLNRLYGVRKRICPTTVDQLAMDFHLKVLHYYLTFGLMDIKDEKNMMTSFVFIKQYYMARADAIGAETAFTVAKQLMLMNKLFLSRDGTEAAYQLLKAVEKHAPLSPEAIILKYRLAYFHDPYFITLVKEDKELDVCTLFRGKYALLPYGSLEELVCRECF